MSAKILQMPKSNQHLWDDLFNGFINQIDRAKDFLCQQPTKAVNHEGGTGAVANRKPSTESANGGAAQSFSAPFYPRNLTQYIDENAVVPAKREQPVDLPDGYVSEDGGYIPDWRDEAQRGDSDTARELQENRGLNGNPHRR